MNRDPRFVDAETGIYFGYFVDPDTGFTIHEDGRQATCVNMVPLSPEMTERVGQKFRSYAEHFVERDWENPGNNPVEVVDVRFKETRYGLKFRLKFAVKVANPFRRGLANDRILFQSGSKFWWKPVALWNRLNMVVAVLVRELNVPDMVLDQGNVVALWSETGWYLTMVQPQVGSHIADVLEEAAHEPSVQRLAAAIAHFNNEVLNPVGE